MKWSGKGRAMAVAVLSVALISSAMVPVHAAETAVDKTFIKHVEETYESMEKQYKIQYETDLQKAVDEFDWFMTIVASDQAKLERLLKEDRQYLTQLLDADYRALNDQWGSQPAYKERLVQYSKQINASSSSGAVTKYFNQLDKKFSTGAYWKYSNEVDPSYSTSLMWKYKNQVNPNFSTGAMNKYASAIDPSDANSIMGKLSRESSIHSDNGTLWNFNQGNITLKDAKGRWDTLFANSSKQLQSSRDMAVSLLKNVRKDSVEGIFRLRDETAAEIIRMRQEMIDILNEERENNFGSGIAVRALDISFDPIKVLLDKSLLAFESPPVLLEGNTLVPLRAIFEKLGAKITWNQQEQSVTAVSGSTTIYLQIGNRQAQINGRTLELEIAPQLIDSLTMVPVRFVSESFGAKVGWDQLIRSVIIETK